MNITDSSPQTATANVTKQNIDLGTIESVENRVHGIGSIMIIGGGALSFFKPEIGFLIAGAGAGLVVGVLAVDHAIRHSGS